MPDTQVSWLPGAIRDVVRLREFTKKENPNAAKKAGQRILSAVEILIKNPQAGTPSRDKDCELFRDLYASFGQGGYTIRYRIKQGRVIITRVWHSREERM